MKVSRYGNTPRNSSSIIESAERIWRRFWWCLGGVDRQRVRVHNIVYSIIMFVVNKPLIIIKQVNARWAEDDVHRQMAIPRTYSASNVVETGF